MARTKKLLLSMTEGETAWGWLYLAVQLLVLPTLLSAAVARIAPENPEFWLNISFYLVNFGAILLIFHKFLGKSLRMVGKRFPDFLGTVVVGFLCCWTANFALNWVILTWLPDFANVNNQAVSQLTAVSFPAMAIATTVLVPPVEECLYRGLVFQGLQRVNRPAAYILSTLAFCVIHVMGYVGVFDNATLAVCFLQYIPAGVCLAWAYERSDTIFAPILIHAAVNAMGMAALR